MQHGVSISNASETARAPEPEDRGRQSNDSVVARGIADRKPKFQRRRSSSHNSFIRSKRSEQPQTPLSRPSTPAYLRGRNPYGRILDNIDHRYRATKGAPHGSASQSESDAEELSHNVGRTTAPTPNLQVGSNPGQLSQSMPMPHAQGRQTSKPISVKAARDFFETKASGARSEAGSPSPLSPISSKGKEVWEGGLTAPKDLPQWRSAESLRIRFSSDSAETGSSARSASQNTSETSTSLRTAPPYSDRVLEIYRPQFSRLRDRFESQASKVGASPRAAIQGAPDGNKSYPCKPSNSSEHTSSKDDVIPVDLVDHDIARHKRHGVGGLGALDGPCNTPDLVNGAYDWSNEVALASPSDASFAWTFKDVRPFSAPPCDLPEELTHDGSGARQSLPSRRRTVEDTGASGAQPGPLGTAPPSKSGGFVKYACGPVWQSDDIVDRTDAANGVCRDCELRNRQKSLAKAGGRTIEMNNGKVSTTTKRQNRAQRQAFSESSSPTSGNSTYDQDLRSRRRRHHSESLPTARYQNDTAKDPRSMIVDILEEHAHTLQQIVDNIKFSRPNIAQLHRASEELVQRSRESTSRIAPRRSKSNLRRCASCYHVCECICHPTHQSVYQPVLPVMYQPIDYMEPVAPYVIPKTVEKLNVGVPGQLGPTLNDERTLLKDRTKSLSELINLVNSAADDLGIDLDDRPTWTDDEKFREAPLEASPSQSDTLLDEAPSGTRGKQADPVLSRIESQARRVSAMTQELEGIKSRSPEEVPDWLASVQTELLGAVDYINSLVDSLALVEPLYEIYEPESEWEEVEIEEPSSSPDNELRFQPPQRRYTGQIAQLQEMIAGLEKTLRQESPRGPKYQVQEPTRAKSVTVQLAPPEEADVGKKEPEPERSSTSRKKSDVKEAEDERPSLPRKKSDVKEVKEEPPTPSPEAMALRRASLKRASLAPSRQQTMRELEREMQEMPEPSPILKKATTLTSPAAETLPVPSRAPTFTSADTVDKAPVAEDKADRKLSRSATAQAARDKVELRAQILDRPETTPPVFKSRTDSTVPFSKALTDALQGFSRTETPLSYIASPPVSRVISRKPTEQTSSLKPISRKVTTSEFSIASPAQPLSRKVTRQDVAIQADHQPPILGTKVVEQEPVVNQAESTPEEDQRRASLETTIACPEKRPSRQPTVRSEPDSVETVIPPDRKPSRCLTGAELADATVPLSRQPTRRRTEKEEPAPRSRQTTRQDLDFQPVSRASPPLQSRRTTRVATKFFDPVQAEQSFPSPELEHQPSISRTNASRKPTGIPSELVEVTDIPQRQSTRQPTMTLPGAFPSVEDLDIAPMRRATNVAESRPTLPAEEPKAELPISDYHTSSVVRRATSHPVDILPSPDVPDRTVRRATTRQSSRRDREHSTVDERSPDQSPDAVYQRLRATSNGGMNKLPPILSSTQSLPVVPASETVAATAEVKNDDSAALATSALPTNKLPSPEPPNKNTVQVDEQTQPQFHADSDSSSNYSNHPFDAVIHRSTTVEMNSAFDLPAPPPSSAPPASPKGPNSQPHGAPDLSHVPTSMAVSESDWTAPSIFSTHRPSTWKRVSQWSLESETTPQPAPPPGESPPPGKRGGYEFGIEAKDVAPVLDLKARRHALEKSQSTHFGSRGPSRDPSRASTFPMPTPVPDEDEDDDKVDAHREISTPNPVKENGVKDASKRGVEERMGVAGEDVHGYRPATGKVEPLGDSPPPLPPSTSERRDVPGNVSVEEPPLKHQKRKKIVKRRVKRSSSSPKPRVTVFDVKGPEVKSRPRPSNAYVSQRAHTSPAWLRLYPQEPQELLRPRLVWPFRTAAPGTSFVPGGTQQRSTRERYQRASSGNESRGSRSGARRGKRSAWTYVPNSQHESEQDREQYTKSGPGQQERDLPTSTAARTREYPPPSTQAPQRRALYSYPSRLPALARTVDYRSLPRASGSLHEHIKPAAGSEFARFSPGLSKSKYQVPADKSRSTRREERKAILEKPHRQTQAQAPAQRHQGQQPTRARTEEKAESNHVRPAWETRRITLPLRRAFFRQQPQQQAGGEKEGAAAGADAGFSAPSGQNRKYRVARILGNGAAAGHAQKSSEKRETEQSSSTSYESADRRVRAGVRDVAANARARQKQKQQSVVSFTVRGDESSGPTRPSAAVGKADRQSVGGSKYGRLAALDGEALQVSGVGRSKVSEKAIKKDEPAPARCAARRPGAQRSAVQGMGTDGPASEREVPTPPPAFHSFFGWKKDGKGGACKSPEPSLKNGRFGVEGFSKGYFIGKQAAPWNPGSLPVNNSTISAGRLRPSKIPRSTHSPRNSRSWGSSRTSRSSVCSANGLTGRRGRFGDTPGKKGCSAESSQHLQISCGTKMKSVHKPSTSTPCPADIAKPPYTPISFFFERIASPKPLAAGSIAEGHAGRKWLSSEQVVEKSDDGCREVLCKGEGKGFKRGAHQHRWGGACKGEAEQGKSRTGIARGGGKRGVNLTKRRWMWWAKG